MLLRMYYALLGLSYVKFVQDPVISGRARDCHSPLSDPQSGANKASCLMEGNCNDDSP